MPTARFPEREEDDVSLDLPLIWAFLIAFAVLAYVILDGFDLGIGILFPFIKGERHRDVMMNSVAPVWDGNETWLILGGGGLFATFPLAYSILLPALYAPLTVMLLALVFRGVAFEFRWRTVRWKWVWDWAFAGGSMAAAFCQGIALGAFIQGIRVSGRAYIGGWLDWLTPFSLLTGVALVIGYGLLGATWLVMKTSGDLQHMAKTSSWRLGLTTLGLIGVVSVWTPFLNPEFMLRWFSWPSIIYVAPVPLLVLATAFALFSGLTNARDVQSFVAAVSLFMLSYIGLGISLFPHIVPPGITIWQAAAPNSSLAFLLVGAGILLPIILTYTVHAYWVFRGKVDVEAGYH
jgi:cytochrome d ubiquinol oxidase subunit II